MIFSMRSCGSPIGTGVVKGVGKGILLRHDKCSLEEFGGPIKLTKEWAKSCIIASKWALVKGELTPNLRYYPVILKISID